MINDAWSVIGEFPSIAEAEVIKLLLESEYVQTKFQSVDPINPHAGVCLLVKTALVHRAIWILKNKGITDTELNFLATGDLNQKPDEDQKVPDDSNFWFLYIGLFSLLGGLGWLFFGVYIKGYGLVDNMDVRIYFSSPMIILGLFVLKLYYDFNKTK